MNNKIRFINVPVVLAGLLILFSCASTMKPWPETLSSADKIMIESSLSEFPAQSQESEDALCAKFIGTGKPGVFYLCTKLIPLGQGNDTDVRYALGSLSRYVSRPGAEKEKAGFVSAALVGIGNTADVEVKSFLMSQIHVIGGEESVGPLSAYLADENLCEPAVQALLSIRSAGVEKALLLALPAAPVNNRITIVRALGDLQSKPAAHVIGQYAGSPDRNMKLAALWALANIADYSSADILKNALKNTSGYEKQQIESFNLLYANRVIEDARMKNEDVGKTMLATGKEESSEKVTMGALQTLVDAQGSDAVGYLIGAVDNGSVTIRKKVLSLALTMNGTDIAKKWMMKMNASKAPVRNEIMDMLFKMNEPSIMPALRQALKTREREEGFIELFNGTDLSGWVGDTLSYVPEFGKIVIYPERKGPGNLYTEKEFDNFIFRFEFLLTPNANNGLGIRAPLSGDAAYVGMELQIIDNNGDAYTKLNPYQFHGSVYGVAAARRGFQKPVGEWNCQEVIADGRNITVILNGVTILDVNLDEAADPHPVDGREHPGLKNGKGHIGFLGHGHKVEFRNIRIKEL